MGLKQVGVFALVLICLVGRTVNAESATANSGHDRPVLRISTGDFSPWADKAAPHSGFVNRIIREAFGREGYQVKFLYWPWKRALESARTGSVDASSFWYLSEEKQKDFHYSQPISEHKELFFYLKKNIIPEWDQLSDLKGLRIGATRSFTYTEEFWKLSEAKSLNVLVANSDELNFKKLMAGRTDVFPAAEVVGWHILKTLQDNPEQSVATLNKPLAKQLGHLLFPKVNEQSMALLEAFNRGLKALKDDGTFEKYRQDMMSGLY